MNKIYNLYNYVKNHKIIIQTFIILSVFIIFFLYSSNKFFVHHFYPKFIGAYTISDNIVNDRNLFRIMYNDNVNEFKTFPFYEVIVGFLAKITDIEIILVGRIINLLTLFALIFLFQRIAKTLNQKYLPLILIAGLCLNEYYVFTFNNFIPSCLNYLLITSAIYFYLNKKFLLAYIFIFLLSAIKTPYAFALVSFMSMDYFLRYSFYRDNFIKFVFNERVKIIFLFALFMPILSVDFLRNYFRGDEILTLSTEGKYNLFNINIISEYLRTGIYRFLNGYINLIYPLNIIFIIIPFIALICRQYKILISILMFYILFLGNFFLFFTSYYKHHYTFLGLGFVFFIFLISTIYPLIKNLKGKNHIRFRYLFVTMFFFLINYKLVNIYVSFHDQYKEEKLVNYVNFFIEDDKNNLVIDDIAFTTKLSFSFMHRLHDIKKANEFTKDCEDNFKNYDLILIIYHNSCFSKLPSHNSRVYAFDPYVLWLRDREIGEAMILNNNHESYDDFEEFFKNKALEERFISNMIIKRYDDKIYIKIEKCISNNEIAYSLAIRSYYNIWGRVVKFLLHLSYEDKETININIFADTKIIGDNCYFITEYKKSNLIKYYDFKKYILRDYEAS